MSVCAIDHCERVAHARGWCRTHYQRWVRTGGTTTKDVRPADCHPGRVHYAFGQCQACYLSERRLTFPSCTPQRRRDRYDATKRRDDKLRRQFGISADEFELMLARQGGGCAICQGPPLGRWNRFAVDHDHATGVVRGLLCVRCNRAIGLFRDDEAVLKRAVAYLNEWRRM